MTEADIYSVLKMRIKTLGSRITALKKTMSEATDSKRIDRLGELQELEKRHKQLDERLHENGPEGRGLLQDVNANLSLLADNIQGGLDSLLFSTEAHYVADERAESGRAL